MFTEYKILIEDLNIAEILIALLSENAFDTFEEKENCLLAYIKTEDESEEVKMYVQQLSNEFYFTFTSHIYEDKNWNEEWEKNFQPVIISDQVGIRAPFHAAKNNILYELIIEPRMSFGTGHHASTFLMIEMISLYAFQNKTVCDAGCGTGVLSIFAAKKGASEIIAIDNNEWAYKNAIDNQKLNQIGHQMKVQMGELDQIENKSFDFILANINKPIILENLSLFKSCLNINGILILSGILLIDLEDILHSATSLGFKLIETKVKEDWVCVVLNIPFLKN